MCGRFGLWTDPQTVQDHFGLQEALPMQPRYNIASSQEILTVGQDERGQRHPAALGWGLIPHWSKDIKSGYRMINARAESLWTNRAMASGWAGASRKAQSFKGCSKPAPATGCTSTRSASR